MIEIIPISIGAAIVAGIALFVSLFLFLLSIRQDKKELWNRWGSGISFVVFLHGMAVFFQFNLAESYLNLLCEHVQISDFVLLTIFCYKFTIHYLGIKSAPYMKRITILHIVLLCIIWWPGLIIQQEFIYRDFLWLSKPYIEPPLTLLGKIMMVYLGGFGLYIIRLWNKKNEKTAIDQKFFISGFIVWYLLCLHDLLIVMGLHSIQYLNIYGFFGFLIAITGITIIKYSEMYKEAEQSASALEVAKAELEIKVNERTLDLLEGNKKLQRAVDQIQESEKRITLFSKQTEQFSLAAASMQMIVDNTKFFDTVCDALVKHSDYNRVLISLFKDTSPYRDIISFGGLDSNIVERLRDVEMPASQYDHVFESGEKIGNQSYYIPHTMKDILKQEATVYGKGNVIDKVDAWHPEDNLFVKMLNEKGEFIGVISVDDSKSGLRPTDETVRPLEIFSSLISQIIVYKKEQEKSKKLEKQLLQSRKMESIGTLTGGIAHDFNNILGIIIGNAELALEKMSDSDQLYSELKSIKYAGNRAADIVKQLLSYGKNEKVNLAPVKMDQILDGLLRLVKSTIPATVAVKTSLKTQGLVVMADPVQVNQVFLNLCLNASQSMENQEGNILISCEMFQLNNEKAEDFPELNQGDYLKIGVCDDGPGINPNIIDRIFDPYFTTKGIGKGSGIGLSVVHGIVKSHNGAVRVKSINGEGSIFEIFFPVVDQEAETIKAKPIPIEMGKQELILLVDDDPMILEIMTRILDRLGYHVITALDPVKALKIFKEKPDSIDLVITDMTMPQMSGITLTQKILAIDSEKPIIICTGYNDLIQGKTAKDLNVSSLVMKPVRINSLSVEVKKALDQR